MAKTSHPMGLLSSFLQKFQGSSSPLTTIVLYGSLGLIAGFCVRHYARSLIAGLIFLVVAVKCGEWAGISALTLKWTRIYQLTGISPHDTLGMTLHLYVQWVREHITSVVSMGVGFFIGSKFV